MENFNLKKTEFEKINTMCYQTLLIKLEHCEMRKMV